MIDPLFWLGLSILLVAVSLTAVLVAALPALRELSRAARSAEKLFDTLNRELPPTLESIRLTGMEITDLTDDLSEGVQSAGRVVQQLDQSISGVKRQAKQAQVTTYSLFAGVKAAWRTFSRPTSTRRTRDSQPTSRNLASTETRSSLTPDPRDAVDLSNRLPSNTRSPIDIEDDYSSHTADFYRRTNYSNHLDDLDDELEGRNGELEGRNDELDELDAI